MKLVTSLSLLAFGMSLPAATYYVDYATGNDSSDGLTTSTPFKHCPGDTRASGSASFTPSTGDLILFKGGVTYTMDTNNIVTLGSHGVTYRGGQIHSTPWGSGWPVIDCTTNYPSLSGVNGSFNATSISNLVVEGLKFSGGPYDDSYSGFISWRGTGGTLANLTVRNNWFENCLESGVFLWGSWDAGTASSEFVISNNVFTSVGTHGVFCRYGLSGVQILDNTFTNIGWRSDSPAPGGDPVGMFGHDSPSWNSDLLVRGNVSYGVPIKSFVILSDQNENAIIERNWIGGTNGYAGLDINGNGTNITVRNNVFDLKVANFYGPVTVDTDQGSGTMVDGLNVYNNTISAQTANIGLIFLGKGSSGSAQTSKNVDIRNNILLSQTASRSIVYIETSATSVPVTDLATFTADYNVNDPDGYATPFHITGTNYTFAQWQGLGYDTHGDEGTPTFSSGWELAASDTLAKGLGVDLSGSFTDDYLGLTRSVPWDIGAYKYVAPPVTGGAATAITVTVGTLTQP